ncbi:MAG TPA: cyclase family protein [Roseiflexaceae bacterium]|nr:cyclase family protein [Roseiflexaceae bacterium]
MCSPEITSKVEAAINRRGFLRAAGMTAIGAAAAPLNWSTSFVGSGRRTDTAITFEKVVDCTHVLEPGIPNYFRLNMEIKPLLTHEEHGVFVNQLIVPEHFGTHFDTPRHFIPGGSTGEAIRPEQLVGPLVIIDIAERAAKNPNTEVTVADLKQWERRNGQIPAGAFVAMYTNWAARWPTAAFLNENASGTYNFPGFGGEAAEFLVKERDIIGIGCDSHSLDIGPSTDFPAHITVLGAGKIGVENLAGLDEVLRQTDRRHGMGPNGYPIIVIGGLKTRNGSGSPIRALALV